MWPLEPNTWYWEMCQIYSFVFLSLCFDLSSKILQSCDVIIQRKIITLHDWICTGFLFPVHLPISSWPVGLGRECPDRLLRLPRIPPPPLQLIFCKIQYSWGWEVCYSWQKFEPALCKHNLKVRWRGRCKQKKATVCKSTEWEFHCIWFLKSLEITCTVMKLKLNSLIPTTTHNLSFMLYLFPFI